MTALSPIGIAFAVFILATAFVVFHNRKRIKTLALRLGIFTFNMETHDSPSLPEADSQASDIPPKKLPPDNPPKAP